MSSNDIARDAARLDDEPCPLCQSPRTHRVIEHIKLDDVEAEKEGQAYRYFGSYKDCGSCWHVWDIERPDE